MHLCISPRPAARAILRKPLQTCNRGRAQRGAAGGLEPVTGLGQNPRPPAFRPGPLPPAMHARVLRADLLLLLTAAIWGSGFVAQRLGMESIGPMLYGALRFALGALVVLPLALRAERQPPPRALTPRAALAVSGVAGLVLFAGASFQQIGLLHTSVANAGFITGLYVVLVPVFGLLTGQRAPAAVWIGAGVAVLGLYLLSVRGDFTVAAGDWLQLAGAGCWAVHVLLLDAVAPRTHALRFACRQFFACALASLVAALLFERIEWAGIVAAAPAIVWGGLLSVGTGYTLQVIAQKDAPAAHAALLMSLEAVFAALAGWWWLDESLDGRGLAGCALMLAGMLLAQGLAGGGRPAATVTAAD